MLAHITDLLTTIITNLYISTGLLGIVLAMAIESCCIPLPSEIVMPIAGIMLATGNAQRHLPGTDPAWPLWVNLLLVGLAGATGCLLGSMAAYGIGARGGRPLMLKYGRYVLISQHDADKADHFFARWGSLTAFFSRLLPVVRTYISLPAGIAKMPFGKFCLYTFIGSLPWCIVLAYLGTVLGNNLETLAPIFHSLDIVIVVAVVVLGTLYVWRHIRNDRKARAEHTIANAMNQPSPSQVWNQQLSPQPNSSQQWGQQPSQPNWNAPQNTQQGWGQPQQPQQQTWSQQAPNQPQQQTWNQPPQVQQGWGQQPQAPNPPSYPTQGQQQGWGQQQPFFPQQGQAPQADDDRTMYRR